MREGERRGEGGSSSFALGRKRKVGACDATFNSGRPRLRRRRSALLEQSARRDLCLNGRAPNYLLNHVIPVSAIVSRQRLRSAQQNTLVVPRYRLTT